MLISKILGIENGTKIFGHGLGNKMGARSGYILGNGLRLSLL